MLTLLEDIVLLTIDPQTGKLRTGNFGVRYTFAGAILFDLALAGRIDTDVDSITVVDSTPTGNAVQDVVLAGLVSGVASLSVRDCVEQLFRKWPNMENEVLAKLVERGLIRHETSKLLWVIDVHRFPLVDGARQRLVTVRLAQAILGDEIPEVRDIMLVSLASACGLLSLVLAPAQLDAREEWIQTLCGIETISRNIGYAIASLAEGLAGGIQPIM